MKRADAIKNIEEIFATDKYGISASFTDEQDAAIRMALAALKNPECMNCGYCQRFADEDAEGKGWCEEHDRAAFCDNSPCGYYE